MSILAGVRVLCGYCEREIGDTPLQEHFDSGECGFVEATYHPLHFADALPTPDEPTYHWMSA